MSKTLSLFMLLHACHHSHVLFFKLSRHFKSHWQSNLSVTVRASWDGDVRATNSLQLMIYLQEFPKLFCSRANTLRIHEERIHFRPYCQLNYEVGANIYEPELLLWCWPVLNAPFFFLTWLMTTISPDLYLSIKHLTSPYIQLPKYSNNSKNSKNTDRRNELYNTAKNTSLINANHIFFDIFQKIVPILGNTCHI